MTQKKKNLKIYKLIQNAFLLYHSYVYFPDDFTRKGNLGSYLIITFKHFFIIPNVQVSQFEFAPEKYHLRNFYFLLYQQ